MVPKLLGLGLKPAKKKLARARCKLGKVTRAKSAKRKGTVVSQTPKPGRRLRKGSKVAVVLSRGP